MKIRPGVMGAIVSIACATGCSDPPATIADAGVDAAPPDLRTIVVEFPATENRDLDLLFVIDDSPSMMDKQVSLAISFPDLVARLEGFPGGLPNLHLGVVTTDMGTSASESATPGPAIGQVGNGGCVGTGKGGSLQTSGATVNGRFLSDLRQSDGARLRNYTSPLTDVFGGMARVGASGCGFEQPLAAMRAALDDHPENVGFLRPGALLAVVFLADEDDCSARSTTLFGPASPALGPLQSFRCTRFGVTCATGGVTEVEMTTLGVKSGCTGATGSPYVDDVDRYRAFLVGLKQHSRRVVVAAITGNATPVVVEQVSPPGGGEALPSLAASCSYTSNSGLEIAVPGVRLKQLADQFPTRSATTSICQLTAPGALEPIAELLLRALGTPCIRASLVDIDPATEGDQYDCLVADVLGEVTTPIPACSVDPGPPCWTIESDPLTCRTDANLKLVVTRAGDPDPAVVTRMRCLLQ